MSPAADLTESMENYLEAIYHLQREQEVARVKDIADRLKVKMPSVSNALNALRERELIHHERYGCVTLTEQGSAMAAGICRRHQALKRFLTDILQLGESRAEDEACRLEHALSATTLARLIGFIDFIKRCPRGGPDWLRHLSGRWEDLACSYDCAKCIESIKVPDRHPFQPREATEKTVTVAEVMPGERGKVLRVSGGRAARRRIMGMGVTPGSDLAVERVAPAGDALEVRVRGYHLSLTKQEAAQIAIELD